MKPASRGNKRFTMAVRLLLVLFSIISLYPLFWMAGSSFRSNKEIFLTPASLPSKFDFRVFAKAWKAASLGTAVPNSLLATMITVLVIVATSSLAAFALARMRFRGQKLILAGFVSGQIVSAQIVLIPLFTLYIRLHWFDTLASLVSACITFGIPLSVFLFWSFFTEIPREIEESTKMDGCSSFLFYARILIPLSTPIFASVVIFQSLFSWNEYLFALTFLKRAEVRTIPVQMQVFFAQYTTDWSMLFAALTITVIPVTVIYLLMQKAFIKGLTAGAIKG